MAYGGRGGGRGGGRQEYDNNLSGALFQNDRQEKDGDPDMKGQCEVEGTEYWLAAWWNKTKNGVEYLKFKMTPKDDRRGGQQQRQPYGQGNRPGNSRGPGARLNPGRRGPNSDQRDDRGDDRRHPNAPDGYDDEPDVPF